MQYGEVLFAKRKPQRPGGNTGLRKEAELGGSTQPDLTQLPLSCLNPGHIPKKDRTYLITVMHHWWKKLKVVKSCQALMFMVIYRIIAVLPAGDFFASGEGDWSMCAEVTSNFTGLAQRKRFFIKEVLSTFWILGNFNNVSCWTLRTWQYSEFLNQLWKFWLSYGPVSGKSTEGISPRNPNRGRGNLRSTIYSVSTYTLPSELLFHPNSYYINVLYECQPLCWLCNDSFIFKNPPEAVNLNKPGIKTQSSRRAWFWAGYSSLADCKYN